MEIRSYKGTPVYQKICVQEIYTIHYFQFTKNFVGEAESHDFWEMVYVDAGKVKVTSGEDSVVLERGEAYFHCPNELHRIVTAETYSSVFIISFGTNSPDMAHLIRCRAALRDTEKQLVTRILEEAERGFEGPWDIMDQTQLIRKSDAPFGCEQMLRLLLEQLLLGIIRYAQGQDSSALEQTAGKNKETHIVESVVAFLLENLENKLTVEEICRNVLFSKSYVEKAFREQMGVGVIQYFNLLKIREAKRMISEGNLRFTEIADRLKFNSVHYFSRLFKSVVGMNPTEYKQSVNQRGLL